MIISKNVILNEESKKMFEVKTKELTFKSINNKYFKSISWYWGGIHSGNSKQEVNSLDELVNFANRFMEKHNAC